MKFEVNQWLQEAIYEHAQKMACKKVAADHGGDADDYRAHDYDIGWGRESANPDYGTFTFEVTKWSKGKRDQSHRVELELRAVVKDYVTGE